MASRRCCVWRHGRQGIQLPGTIHPAFEDLELAAAISDRIIDQVIVDMRGWLDRGLPFGVATEGIETEAHTAG